MRRVKAIFPGSFDPITKGHLDLILRARDLFGEVLIGVAKDTTGKQTLFSFERRLAWVEEAVLDQSGISAKGFSGLLVDFCREEGAQVVVRGVRNGQDFDYEFQMAGLNACLSPGLETILLVSSPEHQYISASMVREIARLGGDVTDFVSLEVAEALRLKKAP